MRVNNNVKLICIVLITMIPTILNGQVKIRLYSDKYPSSSTFNVVSGNYQLDCHNGQKINLKKGDYLIITLANNNLGIKYNLAPSFLCDSISLTASSHDDLFSLRINGKFPVKREYSGHLSCKPDLNTMLFINEIDLEKYIAGVVRAEGGTGKHQEYIKTQAIIARTYLYKYIDKHIIDGYNLCDGTHCQVYHGNTTDDSILAAIDATKGLIIIDADSVPILAAFHSNCGGETAPSEDVWLSALPYLKKVKDVHCGSSSNAKWETSIPLGIWVDYLRDKGYTGTDNSHLNFSQPTRVNNYKAGNFTYPLRQIRNDFGLKSTYFSVQVSGQNVILKGKGYGHGVGLCQEGAMEMANKGNTFKQIINFYYSGVNISEVR